MNDPLVALMERPRDLEDAPVRLILAVRHRENGDYLFVRWPDWPHPAMLALDPPHPQEGLAGGIAALLHARMRVTLESEPRTSGEQRPVRMRHPYIGGETTGWLLPVAVEVSGTPEPDALLEAVIRLSAAEADSQLPTDLERVLFRSVVALLDSDD
jgi:hypothetical protein